MKKALSVLVSAALFLAASGCVVERGPATPSPAPTPVLESATPQSTLDIQHPADVLEEELADLFCGDYSAAVSVVDFDGVYHVSLTLKADDYIPDEVYADYVAGFAPYIVLRSIELKLPVSLVLVSAQAGQFGDEDYQDISWLSMDGISGNLDYIGKSQELLGKRMTKDVTPYDVQDLLGSAGLVFYE